MGRPKADSVKIRKPLIYYSCTLNLGSKYFAHMAFVSEPKI
jgi:hypothetical protein